MDTELRRLATRVSVATAISCISVVGGAGLVLVAQQRERLLEDGGPLPTPVLVLIGLVALGLAALAPWVVTRALVPPHAERLVIPMRQLAQRAEEFGGGGYGLEPGGGAAEVDPVPLESGIPEIDSVARILDRNSRSLARALTAERSFAADASHQLRTPLAALLLRLEEIAEADDVAVAREEAALAIAQTERLAGVVDELLHRTRAGHADGGRSVSLDTVLNTLQQEWQPAFTDAGRRLTVTMERGMIVRSSASAISQILNTLVENSLVHGSGAVTVAARRSGPSAVLQVSDEGPGIPDELARRIFERAVTSGDGTGLGLGVARDNAESFGGRLELVQPRQPVLFALYVSMAPAR
ncbi:sensor histidine kinase [Ornithinicoccus halotolerans]|uniref:sensor histidine kinase n=1 Tax=Ornithinicoccus halotolerans TaxID=1748220 RepID=UPI001E30BF9E|nr:HAMP domain-containing sensor histidine kinase [Ornithinicoccus halotolerans]